jgi:hypothetical protein
MRKIGLPNPWFKRTTRTTNGYTSGRVVRRVQRRHDYTGTVVKLTTIATNVAVFIATVRTMFGF